MSGNILRVGWLSLLTVLLLSLGLAYWGLVRAPELQALPNNARSVEFERKIQRGRILDRNGQVLAETKMTPDGPQRVYTYQPLAPVLGYSSLRYGQGGIEAAFNDELRGNVTGDSWEALRYKLLHETPVGHDVTLTIDLRLQQAADQALGNRRGAIVLMNSDGEIVAMASHPSYDPNRFDELFAQLSADPAAPLVNRATQGLYPPGSTWKTMTLAAGLDSGVTQLSKMVNDGAETLTVSGFPIRCNNNPQGVNTFDIAHAFGWSCNLTFARMALETGEPRYTQYANAFQASSSLPLEIPVAKAQLSRNPLSNPVLLASTGFGQGELLQTPLHLASIGATVANDGRTPRPHLLLNVKDAEGRVMRGPETGVIATPIRPDSAAQVREAMRVAVENGYASGAKIQGFSVGGKTGTAETGQNTPPHAWFLGIAPLDKPRYAVSVLVENGGEGSQVAAPMAQRVLAAALRGP